MTKEKAQEYINIIQAWIDGKQIQVYGLNAWYDIDDPPTFSFNDAKYRIKPEEPMKKPKYLGKYVKWHNNIIYLIHKYDYITETYYIDNICYKEMDIENEFIILED